MTRARLIVVARIAFFLAIGWFAWIGLHGRFDEIADSLAEIRPVTIPAAVALILVGLLLTGLMWLLLLRRFGFPLPLGDGLAMFFIGQLGKYIPGSVWSLGAQAEMARKHGVPSRATVSAGLVFLGYNVTTSVLIGAVTHLGGAVDLPWPNWLSVVAIVGALVGLTPAVVNRLGSWVSGREQPLDLRWTDAAALLGLMGVSWSCYSVALIALDPHPALDRLAALAGAFVLAYAAGVVIVLAPAGLGAREATFVVLLSPTTGVAVATSIALLARVVHTGCDAGLAAATWALAWRSRSADVG